MKILNDILPVPLFWAMLNGILILHWNLTTPTLSELHPLLATVLSRSSCGYFGFTINYLKQAIDISYSMQMAQDVRLLKICNFCEKAFIANNPKAEYDTPQCKNKANVYKSRAKNK